MQPDEMHIGMPVVCTAFFAAFFDEQVKHIVACVSKSN